MTYKKSLDYLASLEPRGWRLGLDRMQAFIDRLGLTHSINEPRKFIHIAGTNGKGSTATFTQNLILLSDKTCGTFLSPFVFSPRERIQFGGNLISEADFARIATQIKPVAESMDQTDFGGVTEFEYKTAMGFLYWEDKHCEYVSLETGLGGRLDATNVVNSAVSIIVSIGLDHQSILGHTESEIATEKAGIIKAGKPVLVGNLSDLAWKSIAKVACEKHSPLFRFGKEIRLDDNGSLTTPWKVFDNFPVPAQTGKWQRQNLAIAVSALLSSGLDISSRVVEEAARTTQIPGRFQRLKFKDKNYILDGAHNGDSAWALKETLIAEFGTNARFVFISNMVKGHNSEPFYAELEEIIDTVIICPIQYHRAVPTSEMSELLNKEAIQNLEAVSVQNAIEITSRFCRDTNLPIIVSGSFYLVGEVGNYLNQIEI